MPPVIGALGALASSAVPAIAGTAGAIGSGLGALGSALGTGAGMVGSGAQNLAGLLMGTPATAGTGAKYGLGSVGLQSSLPAVAAKAATPGLLPTLGGLATTGAGKLIKGLGTPNGQFLAQTGLDYLGKEQAKQEANKQLDEQLATQRKQNLASLLMPQKQARQRKQYYQL